MTPFDAKQLRDNLTLMQQHEHEVQRFLSNLIQTENPNSERFKQAVTAMHLLLDNDDLIAELLSSPTDSPIHRFPDSPTASRGRDKQSYLLDPTQRPAFIAQLQSYFTNYYNPQTRRFRLTDGTTTDAHTFLACVYDIGIRDGLAAEGAAVKDFSDMAKEAALAAGMDFHTAYNSIQKVTRRWRDFAGNRGYFDRAIHLCSLRPEDIHADQQLAYQQAISILNQISKMVTIQ